MDRNQIKKELDEILELSSEKVEQKTARFNESATTSSKNTRSHYQLIGSDSAFLSPWTSETQPASMPSPVDFPTATISRKEQTDAQMQDDEKFAQKKTRDDVDVGCKCDYHKDECENDPQITGLSSANDQPESLTNDDSYKNLVQKSALSLVAEPPKTPPNSATIVVRQGEKEKEPAESLSNLGASMNKLVRAETGVEVLQDGCHWCDQPADKTIDCPVPPSTSYVWHQAGIHDLPNNQSVFPIIILGESSLPQTPAVETRIESQKDHSDAQGESSSLILTQAKPRENWINEQPSTRKEESFDRVTFMKSWVKIQTEEPEKNQAEPRMPSTVKSPRASIIVPETTLEDILSNPTGREVPNDKIDKKAQPATTYHDMISSAKKLEVPVSKEPEKKEPQSLDDEELTRLKTLAVAETSEPEKKDLREKDDEEAPELSQCGCDKCKVNHVIGHPCSIERVDCHIKPTPSFAVVHHDIEDLPLSLQPVRFITTMTSVTHLDPLGASKNDDDDGYQNLQRAESGVIGGVASSAWINENASFVTEEIPRSYERAPLGGNMQPKIENLSCSDDHDGDDDSVTLPELRSSRKDSKLKLFKRVSKIFRRSKDDDEKKK